MKKIISLLVIIIGMYIVFIGIAVQYKINFILVIVGVLVIYFGKKLWSNKTIKYSNSTRTYNSAKENPNLTRFQNRNCSSCGKMSEHEIARLSDGSSRAYVTCALCGHWKEESW